MPQEARRDGFNPHRKPPKAIARSGDKVSRNCKECGAVFECDAWRDKSFCCKAHQEAFKNRRILRGVEIIDHAMRWRKKRKDKTAWVEVCAILSRFIDEDKASGRPSW